MNNSNEHLSAFKALETLNYKLWQERQHVLEEINLRSNTLVLHQLMPEALQKLRAIAELRVQVRDAIRELTPLIEASRHEATKANHQEVTQRVESLPPGWAGPAPVAGCHKRYLNTPEEYVALEEELEEHGLSISFIENRDCRAHPEWARPRKAQGLSPGFYQVD